MQHYTVAVNFCWGVHVELSKIVPLQTYANVSTLSLIVSVREKQEAVKCAFNNDRLRIDVALIGISLQVIEGELPLDPLIFRLELLFLYLRHRFRDDNRTRYLDFLDYFGLVAHNLAFSRRANPFLDRLLTAINSFHDLVSLLLLPLVEDLLSHHRLILDCSLH